VEERDARVTGGIQQAIVPILALRRQDVLG